jgi:hypothetical protein
VFVPELRADAVNAIALLLNKPLFIGQCTTGPAPSGSVVPLDTELVDTWNGHQQDVAVAFAGLQANYWSQLPGWYLCDFRCVFNYTSSTPASLTAGWNGISNGSSYGPVYGAVTANGSTHPQVIARAVDLIAMPLSGPPNGGGDLVQPYAGGTSANLSASGVDIPTASVRWVCAFSGTQPLPVPPLAVAPSPITSAWLNANVRDTIRFLAYPPAFKAHYVAGSSSLANSTLGTPQVINLTTADLDNYSGLTTGASAKYTAPVAGRYLFAGQVNLAGSSSTTWYACGLLVNGSTLYWGAIVRHAGTSLDAGAGITKRLRLSAGDTVQLVAAQASGGSIAYHTNAANQTRLIGLWEGI